MSGFENDLVVVTAVCATDHPEIVARTIVRVAARNPAVVATPFAARALHLAARASPAGAGPAARVLVPGNLPGPQPRVARRLLARIDDYLAEKLGRFESR